MVMSLSAPWDSSIINLFLLSAHSRPEDEVNCRCDEWLGHLLSVRGSDEGGCRRRGCLGGSSGRRLSGKARLRVANYQGEISTIP